MSAEAKRSWRTALPRWPFSGETTGGARLGTGRRASRAGFARIAESVVPDFSETPPPALFEVAVKPSSTKTKKASKQKNEFFKVVKVRGDGRCMFRSLAIGLAHLRKLNLSAGEEETDADQLRLAVAESMCRSPEKRKSFENAAIAISFEMPMETYCKRLLSPGFWGGEPELLVLADILKRPIIVYIPAAKVKSAVNKSGFIPIQTYGSEHAKTKKGTVKQPVRLLYNGENHYDVLI